MALFITSLPPFLHFSPQEGPHSTLNEEEFFDAVEMAYQEDESETVSYIIMI